MRMCECVCACQTLASHNVFLDDEMLVSLGLFHVGFIWSDSLRGAREEEEPKEELEEQLVPGASPEAAVNGGERRRTEARRVAVCRTTLLGHCNGASVDFLTLVQ